MTTYRESRNAAVFSHAQARHDHFYDDYQDLLDRQAEALESEALAIAGSPTRAQDAIDEHADWDLITPLLAKLSHEIVTYSGDERDVGVLEIADEIHALLMRAYTQTAKEQRED